MRDFERKLRLTAALLGAGTCKELARAFRRANPATTFDPERAAKWLQGRAHPRDRTLYEDWATLLDLDRPLAWLLDCELPAFAEAVGARHGVDGPTLARGADSFGQRGRTLKVPAGSPAAGAPFLCGTYLCYRQAFSPYFRGRVLRATLAVEGTTTGGEPLLARYRERLPTGTVEAAGAAVAAGRSLFVDLVSPVAESERAFLSLFMPQPPASCLAGLYCGATLIGPCPEPSCSRVLAVRVQPDRAAAAESTNRYLEEAESVADDLAAHGLAVANRAHLDGRITGFLRGGRGGGLDQVEVATFGELGEIFDRAWIGSQRPGRTPAVPGVGAAGA